MEELEPQPQSTKPTKEVVIDREQKLQAVALYCDLMGASLARHQVAVYEHKDKDHFLLHPDLNWVPMDGGPALRCDQNYVRNEQATRQIRARLASSLPSSYCFPICLPEQTDPYLR